MAYRVVSVFGAATGVGCCILLCVTVDADGETSTMFVFRDAVVFACVPGFALCKFEIIESDKTVRWFGER